MINLSGLAAVAGNAGVAGEEKLRLGTHLRLLCRPVHLHRATHLITHFPCPLLERRDVGSALTVEGGDWGGASELEWRWARLSYSVPARSDTAPEGSGSC